MELDSLYLREDFIYKIPLLLFFFFLFLLGIEGQLSRRQNEYQKKKMCPRRGEAGSLGRETLSRDPFDYLLVTQLIDNST
jgi:hypothetical protein